MPVTNQMVERQRAFLKRHPGTPIKTPDWVWTEDWPAWRLVRAIVMMNEGLRRGVVK